MIKANELRIGNWVYQDCTDMVEEIDQRVVAIDNEHITLEEVHVKIAFIKGIPLTEEWLLKLGFEETYNSSVRLKFDHKIHTECGFDFSKVSDKSMEGFRYYGHYIKIEHVHQLQNIYFALTGQEL